MSQKRMDIIWIPETLIAEDKSEEWVNEGVLYDKFEKDENGFLAGRSVVTNIGVFPYLTADGTITHELRLPEEVLNPESLRTLQMKPLTDDHPMEGVTPDNAKDLTIGSLGEKIKNDAYHVSAPITITDAEAIKKVEDGKRALSCGYTCDVEEVSGTYLGIDYTSIQRNIRYNHVAIVDAGRAGDAAVMKMDSADFAICKHDGKNKLKKKTKQSTDKQEKPMIKVKLDNGIEYEASNEVAVAYADTKKALDTASTALEASNQTHKDETLALDAKLDSEKDRADKAEAELKKANDSIQGKIDEGIKARIALVDSAVSCGVEVKEDQSDSDIKKAVVMKAFDGVDEAKLDEPIYLDARFDSAKDVLVKADKADASNKKKLGDHQDEAETVDSAKARSDFKSNYGFQAK